jgi:hypothetical protein
VSFYVTSKTNFLILLNQMGLKEGERRSKIVEGAATSLLAYGQTLMQVGCIFKVAQYGEDG